jgi:hypothetical protein
LSDARHVDLDICRQLAAIGVDELDLSAGTLAAAASSASGGTCGVSPSNPQSRTSGHRVEQPSLAR